MFLSSLFLRKVPRIRPFTADSEDEVIPVPYAIQKDNKYPSQVVIPVLDRIWQSKYFSIVLLEDWIRRTRDVEIRAGLETQVIDERRHLHILGDEIRRAGGRPSATNRESPMGRPFAVTTALVSDLHRLCAYHRGIKTFTLNRCSHLIPAVATDLAIALDRIARDDERHIRWADIRLARLLTYDEIRATSLLTSRIRAAMEAVWEKPWRELTRHSRAYGSQ